MVDYISFQMEASNPLQFLQLSVGHDLLKVQVIQQKTVLSDIETEISVN